MDNRLIFVIATMLLVSSACLAGTGLGKEINGSGNIASETRQVGGFEEIDICCGMQLLLTQEEAETLEIQADENLLPEIVTEVSTGELIIRYKDTNGGTRYLPSQPVRVRVGAIEIRNLVVSGGGALEAGPLQTDHLAIDLSGGSRATLDIITADSLRVEVSGGGDLSTQGLELTAMELDLSGGSTASLGAMQAESLKLESSGGGEIAVAGGVTIQDLSFSGGTSYQAGDLQSQDARINMSGGGAVTLWVTEALDADLSGGARIEYYGQPRITEQLSGGSELVSLGNR